MSGYGEIIEPRTVRFERLLPGPIELVWQFLTDSDKRALWLASGTMEPRVGSKCSLRYDNENLSPDRTPPRRGTRAEAALSRSIRLRASSPRAFSA